MRVTPLENPYQPIWLCVNVNPKGLGFSYVPTFCLNIKNWSCILTISCWNTSLGLLSHFLFSFGLGGSIRSLFVRFSNEVWFLVYSMCFVFLPRMQKTRRIGLGAQAVRFLISLVKKTWSFCKCLCQNDHLFFKNVKTQHRERSYADFRFYNFKIDLRILLFVLQIIFWWY